MSQVITLPPKDREKAIARCCEALKYFHLGKPVNVKMSIARPERTPPQCRYLWGVAYELLHKATGYEKDDIHEYLCMKHFGSRSKRLPGGRHEDIPIRTTTTDESGNRDVLDGSAFWEFVELVQRVGAKAGVVIPDPEGEQERRYG